MPTPYSSGPHILSVQGGVPECIQIRAPHRGTIKAIKFEQVLGAAADCDFEVFTSEKACPPDPNYLGPSSDSSAWSSESLDENVEGPRSAYSIFGAKTMNSGAAFAEYGLDHAFTNKDGTPTNPQRFLYVDVRSGGTGGKKFALTLEMETSPVG